MKFGTNSGIFLPFSAFFGHFLWESRDISSFSENIREILIKFHQNFAEKWPNSLTKVGMKWNFISFHFIPAKKFDGFLLEFWGVSGAKAKKSCRARKMLKNEPTLAIVAVDTGENEPLKVWGVSFHYFNRILNINTLPWIWEQPVLQLGWATMPKVMLCGPPWASRRKEKAEHLDPAALVSLEPPVDRLPRAPPNS